MSRNSVAEFFEPSTKYIDAELWRIENDYNDAIKKQKEEYHQKTKLLIDTRIANQKTVFEEQFKNRVNGIFNKTIYVEVPVGHPFNIILGSIQTDILTEYQIRKGVTASYRDPFVDTYITFNEDTAYLQEYIGDFKDTQRILKIFNEMTQIVQKVGSGEWKATPTLFSVDTTISNENKNSTTQGQEASEKKMDESTSS